MRRASINAVLPTRRFAFIIGVGVFLIILLLQLTPAISTLDTTVQDSFFRTRSFFDGFSTLREGVTMRAQNPNVHPDILILGVDNASLNRFGRWPFPRRIHANLINRLARIQNQDARERALFLDFFFTERSRNATDDALLLQSIQQNNRVFLETVFSVDEPQQQDYQQMIQRFNALVVNAGTIENVSGSWVEMMPYHGIEAPLTPYSSAARGYGHANFVADFSDDVFRKQPVIAKFSQEKEVYTLEDLRAGDITVDPDSYERLAWLDRQGEHHHVAWPLSEDDIDELEGALEDQAPLYHPQDGSEPIYRIRKFQDSFVPSITLSLALEYFNKSFEDIKVVIGSHITINSPQRFNPAIGEWDPYTLLSRPAEYDKDGTLVREAEYRAPAEITIPIDDQGEMAINYVGRRSSSSPQGYQSFPVRSYAGYAAGNTSAVPATWSQTLALENKIVMVGAFSTGIADDEKFTPYGLMYGVEMHANALNTILMDRFIHPVPQWLNLMILAGLILLTALIVSRFSTIWSLLIVILSLALLYAGFFRIFESSNYFIPFASPAFGIFFTFLAVVVYRVMIEEKDKRRIRDMFGRYVSPQVVNQILENPPELGGVDKELTVFFSDIRGFTTLSESMTPQELVNHLNMYLTAMTDIILEYKGTLDKYVGDEVMCFWGAPLPQEDHAFMACQCAVKQMQALKQLNENWPPEKRIDIGIGINSGVMTVGNMGSLGRMNYTLMGDNVNLGARLEGTNKLYKTNIIISEFTYGLVKDRVIAREMDNIRVKGKNRPVLIYELIDIRE